MLPTLIMHPSLAARVVNTLPFHAKVRRRQLCVPKRMSKHRASRYWQIGLWVVISNASRHSVMPTIQRTNERSPVYFTHLDTADIVRSKRFDATDAEFTHKRLVLFTLALEGFATAVQDCVRQGRRVFAGGFAARASRR